MRVAYERLLDAQLIVSSRTSGTRVAERPPRAAVAIRAVDAENGIPDLYRDFSSAPGIFQMGVPALDHFPTKLFARIRGHSVRTEVTARGGYPDPRGESELRREIAAHLAISRSLECLPSQIVITAGYTGALGLILRVLRLEGRSAWTEDPGFPLARKALQIAQLTTVPIPIDDDGLDVAHGLTTRPTPHWLSSRRDSRRRWVPRCHSRVA